MIIKAALLKDKLIMFDYEVNQKNQLIVKKKLLLVHKQIVDLLKGYKQDGLIKSIYIPRDVKMIGEKKFARGRKTEFQEELDELIKAKIEIKKSMNKIRIFF